MPIGLGIRVYFREPRAAAGVMPEITFVTDESGFVLHGRVAPAAVCRRGVLHQKR